MPRFKTVKVRGKELDIIHIIAARGGSERMYRKNLRPFAGKSLLEWGIIQAQTCKYICDVYVVTEDDEIEEVAKGYGLRVLREPVAFSGAPGGAGHALHHARFTIANERKFDLEYNKLITKPLIKPGDIDHLFERYWQSRIDGAEFVVRANHMMITKEISKYVSKICLANLNGIYFHISGGIVFNPAVSFNLMPYSNGNAYYELESWQFLEIDTEEDFEMAEMLFEKKILKGNPNVYQDYAKSNPRPLHDYWKYNGTIGVEDDE